MKVPWSAASIRVRLTGWYAVVLSLMLVVYATATFVAVRHEFQEQLDDQLHDDFESAEAFLTPTPDGRVAWTGDRHHDPADDEDRGSDVWSPNGDQISRSGASAALPPVALATAGAQPHYESIVAGGRSWRTLIGTTLVSGRSVVLRVARSEERLREQLSEVLKVLVLGLPLVIVLAGLGGYLLARRALAPIDRLAAFYHKYYQPDNAVLAIAGLHMADNQSDPGTDHRYGGSQRSKSGKAVCRDHPAPEPCGAEPANAGARDVQPHDRSAHVFRHIAQ
jgi:hypothetical protein